MNDVTERLAALARHREGEHDPHVDDIARERMVAALQKRPRRTERGRLLMVAALAFTVGALVVHFSPTDRPAAAPAPTLAYETTDALQDGTLRADESDASVRFSDGTTFAVSKGGVLALERVDATGARLKLERGHVDAEVTPGRGLQWLVVAGPYEVRVTGTAFGVTWVPDEQSIDVVLTRGSVTVVGPAMDGGLELRPGQHLQANASSQAIAVGPIEDPPSAPSTSASTAATPPPSASPSAAPAPAAPSTSWAERVAAGEYDVVLQEAEALGIESVFASASAGRIVALGDAARYRGRGDVARRCLLALRERFPQTPAGQSASFLLGRMAEGSPSSAIGWYDRYLAESPGGPYAADALGRKLALLARTNKGAARPVARQYLAAYPKGPYAELARTLVR